MKKIIISTIALALLLTLALPGLAETQPNVLVVTGNATVSLQADIATIEIGAMTRGITVSEAQKENAGIMEKVISETEKLGIAREDIKTSQFSVWYDQYNTDTSASDSQSGGSYSVTNMVFITIRDIEKISAVIDGAAAVGANNIYNLTFQASKSDEAYAKALKRAVEDGIAKAKVLAEATGKTLGVIARVEANDYFGGQYGSENSLNMSGAMDSKTSILTGDVSIVANVILTFGLE